MVFKSRKGGTRAVGCRGNGRYSQGEQVEDGPMGGREVADQDCHLHSGTLPAWDYEGEMVCSAGGLGQQVGVHRCLVPGLGGLP